MANLLEDLTDKQRAYVEARLRGATVLEAGAEAGYTMTENNLRTHLERNPKIKVILREANRVAAAKLSLTREDVLQGFLDAVEAAGSSQDLTAAWREIGRVLGVYEPTKVEVDVNAMTQAQLQELSTQDLAALAGAHGLFIEGEFSREEEDAEVQPSLTQESADAIPTEIGTRIDEAEGARVEAESEDADRDGAHAEADAGDERERTGAA